MLGTLFLGDEISCIGGWKEMEKIGVNEENEVVSGGIY